MTTAHDLTPATPQHFIHLCRSVGGSYLSCAGHPDVQTPHLDRLAKKGMRFTQAYTNSPLCTPYRGCLMTGRYPIQTGVLKNWDTLPEGIPTLAQSFESHGYATHYLGKWHLSGQIQGIQAVPKDKRGGYRDFKAWESGHAWHWEQEIFDNDQAEAIILKGHESDALTDMACEQLSQFSQTQQNDATTEPFFYTISYQAPHPICEAPEPYKSMYKADELTLPPTFQANARFAGYGHYKVDMDAKEWTERHYGEITHLDAALGRLFEHLESTGLADNTVIVFSSDHGDMAGCHGLFEKQVFYEMACHVPLIVYDPRVKTKHVEECNTCDTLVSTVDIFPTLLDLAGAEIPSFCEGKSFRPQLCGESSPSDHDVIFFETVKGFALRKGPYKLSVTRDTGEAKQLFHLDSDPWECDNLLDHPEHQEAKKSLLALLNRVKDELHSRAYR